MLGQDNLCQIQDQKPEMCKRYYCEKALSEPKNETDKKLSTEK
jgi:hypothetical protein